MKKLSLLLYLVMVFGIARGDTWPAAELKIVTSSDGSALLRITPAGSSGSHAVAIVMRFDKATREYRKVAEFKLRNPWAPHQAVITNDARFVVTFDDWGEIGRTENVVVVYRGSGQAIKAWGLSDIFSEEEIKTFRSSVSSTWWRGDVELTERDRFSPIVAIKPGEGTEPRKGRTPGYPYYFDVEALKFTK
jgi:hypothetical protein